MLGLLGLTPITVLPATLYASTPPCSGSSVIGGSTGCEGSSSKGTSYGRQFFLLLG